jgi:N-acetylneuraminate lyase
MTHVFEGIIPAIHTAFGPNEELNLKAQRKLARRLVAQGVHGIFACGTAGEFPLLGVDEREAIVEAIAAETLGHAALIVHVGAMRPKDSIRLAQHAARLGAQAISSVPPLYYATSKAAILHAIEDIAVSTQLPFLYYHIPARVHVPLDEELLQGLLTIPNLRGIKYSHHDLAQLERIASLGPFRMRVLCGSDDILLAALAMGASGGIGATYNFLAADFISLWKQFQEGRMQDARATQARVNKVLRAVNQYPFIAASKESVRLMAIEDLGCPRLPQSRLDAEEKRRLRRAIIEAGLTEVLQHFPEG